ncbi:hypothetical protein [Haloparvum sedimenti]|uniref:hypothetical protein n=1 Tax=Haloparvum sedimenti TaxID=1678448 RepID=UPI000F782B70|nr:hypothetical protein [Haloparvum sedimenti]
MSKRSPRAPAESDARGPQKGGEESTADLPDVGRRPDAVTVAVRLWTALGRRTVEVSVSPLATDAAAVDMAREQEEIPTALFRRGEVLA